MKNNLQEKGFIKLILLIIVILVVLSFNGFDPQTIWEDYIVKGIVFVWSIISWAVDILVGLIKAALASFEIIGNILDKINGGSGN